MDSQSVAVSVIVPAYNEERTLEEVVNRLLAVPISKEILIVDDCSTDKTAEIAQSFGEKVVYVRQTRNQGKGAAIREGLKHAKGEVVIIQDADLEYFPEDIPQVVQPILSGQAEVVYGTRFKRGLHPRMAWPNKMVNVLLRWAVRLLFSKKITDEATCYKAIKTSVLRQMNLKCNRFEFCPEVTAKALRMGKDIREVEIRYEPRTRKEGKKIRWTDGVEAFWTLIKYRFSRF